MGVRHDITSLTAPYDKAVIITDENVNPQLYGELFDFPKIVTASGEQSQNPGRTREVDPCRDGGFRSNQAFSYVGFGRRRSGRRGWFLRRYLYAGDPLHPNSHYPPRRGRQVLSAARLAVDVPGKEPGGCFPPAHNGCS